MVGNGRAAHFHHRRDINHTLFAVAEDPEDPDSGGITELFENIREDLEVFGGGHMGLKLFHGLAVLMRQGEIFHNRISTPSYVVVYHRWLFLKTVPFVWPCSLRHREIPVRRRRGKKIQARIPIFRLFPR